MNTTIQCFILLACTAVYTSATIKGCRCVKASKSVRRSLIANVVVNDPRPYCNKKEVIVTLKDNRLTCLDPKQRFTKLVLQTIQMQRMINAAKMNTTGSITATAPPSVPNTEPTMAPPTSP
ncbi:growth-regulated alpha protein-like [Pempheris klunzingeri]|uniref:growth-regulated alpha protein-like n=1 Tax=Pempheris klunzingeri TaxID=3127111 RepID=UPI0039810F07